MVKELIRNGGFERGNLDFWKVVFGTVSVVSDVKKRGSYSAKMITGDYDSVKLDSKDYIEVTPFALYKHTGWYKNVDLTKMQAMAMFYDSNIDRITDADIIIWEKTGAFDWTYCEGWFVTPPEASYMVLGIAGTGTSGKYGYIDSISLQEIDLSRLAVYTKELLEVEDLPLPGTYYSDEVFSGLWKYGEFFLNVTSISGTDPKIDIVIQAYDPSTGLWKNIVKYDQVTSTGSQLKVATAGLGWKIRVKYTIHSDTSDADFVVSAVFKR